MNEIDLLKTLIHEAPDSMTKEALSHELVRIEIKQMQSGKPTVSLNKCEETATLRKMIGETRNFTVKQVLNQRLEKLSGGNW